MHSAQLNLKTVYYNKDFKNFCQSSKDRETRTLLETTGELFYTIIEDSSNVSINSSFEKKIDLINKKIKEYNKQIDRHANTNVILKIFANIFYDLCNYIGLDITVKDYIPAAQAQKISHELSAKLLISPQRTTLIPALKIDHPTLVLRDFFNQMENCWNDEADPFLTHYTNTEGWKGENLEESLKNSRKLFNLEKPPISDNDKPFMKKWELELTRNSIKIGDQINNTTNPGEGSTPEQIALSVYKQILDFCEGDYELVKQICNITRQDTLIFFQTKIGKGIYYNNFENFANITLESDTKTIRTAEIKEADFNKDLYNKISKIPRFSIYKNASGEIIVESFIALRVNDPRTFESRPKDTHTNFAYAKAFFNITKNEINLHYSISNSIKNNDSHEANTAKEEFFKFINS